MDDGTFAAGGALKNTVEERVCDGKAACGRICESAGVARVGGGGLGLRWCVCLGFFFFFWMKEIRCVGCLVVFSLRLDAVPRFRPCLLPAVLLRVALPSPPAA